MRAISTSSGLGGDALLIEDAILPISVDVAGPMSFVEFHVDHTRVARGLEQRAPSVFVFDVAVPSVRDALGLIAW